MHAALTTEFAGVAGVHARETGPPSEDFGGWRAGAVWGITHGSNVREHISARISNGFPR